MILTTFHRCIQSRAYTFLSTLVDYAIVRHRHAFDRALLKPKVRCHFPKPHEVKRINIHGWEARMSTVEGRRVLMQRVLKGRHVLSH